MQRRSLHAIVNSLLPADLVIEELCSSGTLAREISVLFQDQRSAQGMTVQTPEDRHAKSIGALGGAFGRLTGIGMLALPGDRTYFAAGPIMSALGNAPFGSVQDDVVGFLIEFGLPDPEARRFEGLIQDGAFLISVHDQDDDGITLAREILAEAGANQVVITGPREPEPEPPQQIAALEQMAFRPAPEQRTRRLAEG
jgi:hypothetical protein